MTTIWQGGHLTKTERILIILSTTAFIFGLLIVLGLTIRSILGGPHFDFSNVIFVMLLALPALYIRKRVNSRLLKQEGISEGQIHQIREEQKVLKYGLESVKGSWGLIIGVAIIGFLFFLYYFLFR